MDFINHLSDHDDEVFAALSHIFSRHIENAMKKQIDEPRIYKMNCPEAPNTKMALEVLTPGLAEVAYNVQPKGYKHFELVGRVEFPGSGLDPHTGSDRPCLSLHGFNYHYRPEHSRLLTERDFDREARNRSFDNEEAYEGALAHWQRQVERDNAHLAGWWDHIKQSEMISRLKNT